MDGTCSWKMFWILPTCLSRIITSLATGFIHSSYTTTHPPALSPLLPLTLKYLLSHTLQHPLPLSSSSFLFSHPITPHFSPSLPPSFSTDTKTPCISSTNACLLGVKCPSKKEGNTTLCILKIRASTTWWSAKGQVRHPTIFDPLV